VHVEQPVARRAAMLLSMRAPGCIGNSDSGIDIRSLTLAARGAQIEGMDGSTA
jgi:hypothetical protein